MDEYFKLSSSEKTNQKNQNIQNTDVEFQKKGQKYLKFCRNYDIIIFVSIGRGLDIK